MRFRTKFVGGLLIVAVVAVAAWWYRESEWQRSWGRVRGGMTVQQVREAIGRDEDEPDERPTTTGEFERSWTFRRCRITVVFDQDGRSTYKEFAPSYCGVTPLQGKYVRE